MENVVITGGAMLTEDFDSDSSQYLFPVLKLENVDFKEAIRIRGLKYLTNATKMVLVTTNLSKDHASIKEFASERCGIVVATNFSSLGTIVDFDLTTLREGPRAVSAMQGPNLILNATAARLGIYYDITGFNTTISSGQNASIDALEYAYEMIQKKEVDMVIVAGVEDVQAEYRAWLADNEIANDDFRKIKSFGGTVILESETHALQRGAKIYGRILRFSSYFNGSYLAGDKNNKDIKNEYDEILSELIDNSNVIDNICIADNHLFEREQNELRYLREKFCCTNIISVYNVFGGELRGSTGIAQMLHCLSFFTPGEGIIFSSDWTGNFKGVLLERVTTGK